MQPTAFVIVDDHSIVIDGVKSVLQETNEFCCVGAVQSVAQARAVLPSLQFSFALVDVSLPDGTGIEVCQWLCAERPEIRVVALSMHYEPHFIRAMMQAGAVGYILKSANKHELLAMLRSVQQGNKVLSSDAIDALLTEQNPEPMPPTTIQISAEVASLFSSPNASRTPPQGPPTPMPPKHGAKNTEPNPLTKREREVVGKLTQGCSSKEIAVALAVSVSTVETHRKRILQKTACANTAELVRRAIENGWV
jgi:DNA-binding NarL/FixJ family response regulator